MYSLQIVVEPFFKIQKEHTQMVRSYIHHNKDITHPDFPHGKFAGYKAGCKCELCNAANNKQKLEGYHKRKLEKPPDNGLKTCGGCGANKPYSEFYPQNNKYLGSYCKDCATIQRRKYFYLRKYNLSLETYEKMIEQQKSLCAICNQLFKGYREPFVDHCHTTSKVRGLLCGKCNFGIGQFNDDTILLRAAILYLENSAADCPEGSSQQLAQFIESKNLPSD